MMSDVIGYPVSAAKNTFIPYFQYKIGVYQRDYYLYFATPYDGYEIIKHIEFHYNAYDNKQTNLFLLYVSFKTIRIFV